MFYTGLDPRDMKPVYVPKSREEKAMQRALLQFSQPRNYDLVHKALVEAGREDLIGFGPRCLSASTCPVWPSIKPRGEFRDFGNSKGGNKGSKNGKGKKESNGNKGSKNSRDSRNSNNRKSSSRGNDTRNSGRNNGSKNSGRGKSSGKNSKRRPR